VVPLVERCAKCGYEPTEAEAAFARQFPRLEAIAEGRVVVPLVERCAKCGYEPTAADEQQRAKAIERATRPGEQVRAMEALARVGMSSQISVDDVKARLISQVQELRGWGKECELPAGQLETLLDRLQLVWR
jgi:Zn ribbon nucleic-acid-binding protein